MRVITTICLYDADLMRKQESGKKMETIVHMLLSKYQISFEKHSDVTVLNTLMGFFIYRETDIKKMLKIQDILNKGVKRGLIHLFQIPHNFIYSLQDYLQFLLACKVESSLCRRQWCPCTVSAHPYSGSPKINFFVQALLWNSFVSFSHITLCHTMYATETNGFWGFVFCFFPL